MRKIGKANIGKNFAAKKIFAKKFICVMMLHVINSS
jgi:hypothetical protein